MTGHGRNRYLEGCPCNECRDAYAAWVTGETPKRTIAWREQAACKGKPQAVWYPTSAGTGNANPSLYNPARRICERCPVMAECLDFALSTNQTEGMWGGLTPKERRERRAHEALPVAV